MDYKETKELPLPEAAVGSDAPYKLVKGLPYEYPMAEGVVGSAVELTEQTPILFKPLKVANMVIPNRTGVSPMCQYTSEEGYPTEYHKIHYGALTTRGPGLVIVEATAVAPNAGTAIVDLGIWKDSQAAAYKPIVDYAHANTSRIGIQIGHAGRKAMQSALFEYLENFDPRGDKDKVFGPSAVDYRKNGRLPTPKELTTEQIKDLVKKFGQAAKRAYEISGFDFVEIHGAHGYLICEFLSAHSNKRTDEYGGSFENRIRFLTEIVEEVRANVPKDYPIFCRLSADELHHSNPDAWTIDDTLKLAPILVEKGVNVIDTSAGGNDAEADRVKVPFGAHVEYAKKIKEVVKDTALVACVGKLNDSAKVNKLLEEGAFDIALMGSQFLANPGLTLSWADELNVEVHRISSHWPSRPKYAEMIAYIQSTYK